MDKFSRYIEKSSRARDRKLKYDFLPSLVEIVDRPAHPAGTVIIFTIALLLFAAAGWAAFSKLDIVVTGDGYVVSAENPQEFECYLSDKYRADIDVGMPVNLKLSAYSFSDYGAILGTISSISHTSYTSDRYGTVYKINISINCDEMNPRIELFSGMSGTAEIIIGKQTVLEYFINPISDTIRGAMRER